MPLSAGTQYTLSVSIAAAAGETGGAGGDTNGDTDLLCIPACGMFPIAGSDSKHDDYTVLASGAPTGGLVGNGPWKSFSMTFTPSVNCPAVMLGASSTQSIATSPSVIASYVFYDALNLQETATASGTCDANNNCITNT